jgi:hypothetical protein
MHDHETYAMLSQHTARPPRISFSGAIRTLEAFGETACPLLPFEQRRRVDDELKAAALAFLTYHFTPLLVPIDGDFGAAFQAAGLVLKHADAETHRRFLEDVVMNVVNPANHDRFAAMIRNTIPRETLEATLLRHARSGNELHANNVFWLLYSIGVEFDDAFWRELRAIAVDLVARRTTSRPLREVAAQLI